MGWRRAVCLISLTMATVFPVGSNAETWPVSYWTPPFDYRGTARTVSYEPLDRASRPWRFCISYPHLKDPYWLSVNFGMKVEAQRLGVGFRLQEAGGYLHLDRQVVQIRNCTAEGADALIVGAVSYSKLTDLVQDVAKSIPVIATVNDMADAGLAAKVGVSWIEMGEVTGAYLATRHPPGTEMKSIALLPGPVGPEWVDFVMEGFSRAIAGSAVEVAVVKRGDTGKEIQRTLVEEALEEQPDIDYIVGTSVTAEAAVSLLRDRKEPAPDVVSFYLTHGVYRGIKRGKILAAPTDHPALQGRMSIEVAVRVLEDRLVNEHIGPAIMMVDQKNIDRLDLDLSLAPASFVPTFDFP